MEQREGVCVCVTLMQGGQQLVASNARTRSMIADPMAGAHPARRAPSRPCRTHEGLRNAPLAAGTAYAKALGDPIQTSFSPTKSTLEP